MSTLSKKIGILVGEDDKNTRLVLSKTLSANGFSVKEAARAAKVYKSIDPDTHLLLVEIGLPDFDGQNLVERLRRRYDTNRLRICFASALVAQDSIRRSIEVGGDDYLIKPIDSDVLLHKLTRLLGQPSPEFVWVSADFSANLLESLVLPDLAVMRVNESGLFTKSSANFVKDSHIKIDCPGLSKLIGHPLREVLQRVVSFDRASSSRCFFSTEFLGVNEQFTAPLRIPTIGGQYLAQN